MGTERPQKPHYSRSMSMMWGADPADGLWAPVAVDADGYLYQKGYVKDFESLEWVPATNKVTIGNILVTEQYDSITLGYDGTKLSTVTYKSDGTTVATLTLGYSGDTLTGVTKT